MRIVDMMRTVRNHGWSIFVGAFLIAPQMTMMTPDAHAQSSTPEACTVPAEHLAHELLARFNAMLKTRHPDRVAQLFAADGALLGLGSPVVRANYLAIRDYYVYFLQFEPQVRVKTSEVEVGCNYLIDSGTFTWSLKTRGTGLTETRDTRYHLIYELAGGQWHLTQFGETFVHETDRLAGFSVPPPSPQRGSAPAVAGFLKRIQPLGPKPGASGDQSQPANDDGDASATRGSRGGAPSKARPAADPFGGPEQLLR